MVEIVNQGAHRKRFTKASERESVSLDNYSEPSSQGEHSESGTWQLAQQKEEYHAVYIQRSQATKKYNETVDRMTKTTIITWHICLRSRGLITLLEFNELCRIW